MSLKKKRDKKSKQELHEEEASAKYSSLLVQSVKSLRKELKVVKSFECQKVIRKIKSFQESTFPTAIQQEIGLDRRPDDDHTHIPSIDFSKQNKHDAYDDVIVKGTEEEVNVVVNLGSHIREINKIEAKLKFIKNFNIDFADET